MNPSENQFQRTELLIGAKGIEILQKANIAIFGLGGVGSFVAEALARAGVGNFLLVDGDVISRTNLNRQLIALHSTLGRPKTAVMKERILDINPTANVAVFEKYYTAENQWEIDFSQFSYVVDAIDMVTSKILLITKAKQAGVPVICSMGTGNKLNPNGFLLDDISRTSVCPLAKVMRKECKDRGLTDILAVYSKEPPRKPNVCPETIPEGKRQIPGSISFVPSAAGLVLAGEVIRSLINE